MFALNKKYTPLANQQEAIDSLVLSLGRESKRTLLGATGTGKTFLMASLISVTQKPALVIAPNKTLAAQLYGEFSEMMPETAVEFFVSYYDYYQPEAYVVASDLFIEKDAAINEEIEKRRHSATSSLLARRDVVVVASVSCIYGAGNPKYYLEETLDFTVGKKYKQEELTQSLVQMQYVRNDALLQQSSFRIQGDTIEIFPAGEDLAVRLRFWGEELEQIERFSPLENNPLQIKDITISPASHYLLPDRDLEDVCQEIESELSFRKQELLDLGLALEADRLNKRVSYDLEMIREQGFVAGIENYSRILDGRKEGEPPYTLLDYFPDDFLCFVDESHVTIPQLAGMYRGDRSRKKNLVEHGFRLPSALDNRPLRLNEFLERTGQLICVSATPGEWESENAPVAAEQIIRPTGILDPEISVRPKSGQMEDFLREIKQRTAAGQRVLATALTKKMSEELADYLLERGIKCRYMHSDIDTLERIEIIKQLRSGIIDVLVGVNLLREGLDLPEVSLVAVFDADREGFLRNRISLIQTAGRAARNTEGQVIFYADDETPSMKRALEETRRRRALQAAYNKQHKISPRPLQKTAPAPASKKTLSQKDLRAEIIDLEGEMAALSENLRFEEAARVRDEIKELEALLGK